MCYNCYFSGIWCDYYFCGFKVKIYIMMVIRYCVVMNGDWYFFCLFSFGF